MIRGVVLPLTDAQVVARALYLTRERPAATLDRHINWTGREHEACPEIYYLLRDHNGGKDPAAMDPADRWSVQGSTRVNRTSDCIGGAVWVSGFDRFQPVRFAHVPDYDGWINTDSMMWEARHAGLCFTSRQNPAPGWMIVCESGSPGHKIGHVGVIVGYTLAEWDPRDRACWAAIEVVNVAAYRNQDGSPAVANRRTTGVGWFGTGAMFVKSIMKE